MRLSEAVWAILIALDILFCTLWLAPLYVVGLASRPSGRQMISSYVGEASFNGHRWAKWAERVIDWLALKCGDAPQHCYRAFRKYQFLDD